MKEVRITDIKGVTVGHAQNYEGASGCTVLLFDGSYLASCDVRGGGPASKETELLKPTCSNQGIHAI
ncbi:MAG: P1 family peptidase, partial [Firmicutes bacterium]|nr:P1 family peptidase [Bacillota bacterium]